MDRPPKESGIKPALRSLFAREPEWQFSLMLALEAVFMFVAVPALSTGRDDRDLVTVLQLVLAGTVIGLVANSTWVRLALAASFGLTLIARLLPGVVPQITTVAISLIYTALVIGVMARAVFGSGEVNRHRIAGAVFIYLDIALLFALAYNLLSIANAGALSGMLPGRRLSQLIHLSIATLTTIGDGQITARSAFASSLMDLETIIGQLFPAILLSRLVGLQLYRSQG